MIRLDKYISSQTKYSRSEVKQLVKKGLVSVDGIICSSYDLKVDENTSTISVNGTVLSYEEHVYFMFNKPSGCVSANEDVKERTVLDYFADEPRVKELFCVGRLDRDTEGLMLVTDDGELAHCLLSPSKHVDKTYYARLEHPLSAEDVRQLEQGVDIGDDRPTRPAKVGYVAAACEVRLTICEGRFHQVKRMFEAVGNRVVYLKRISMGNLKLDNTLEKGTYRKLCREEIESVKGKEGIFV